MPVGSHCGRPHGGKPDDGQDAGSNRPLLLWRQPRLRIHPVSKGAEHCKGKPTSCKLECHMACQQLPASSALALRQSRTTRQSRTPPLSPQPTSFSSANKACKHPAEASISSIIHPTFTLQASPAWTVASAASGPPADPPNLAHPPPTRSSAACRSSPAALACSAGCPGCRC